MCWFVAGRVLVRFLKAAIDAQSESHITTLRAEVDFIRYVMALFQPACIHVVPDPSYAKLAKASRMLVSVVCDGTCIQID